MNTDLLNKLAVIAAIGGTIAVNALIIGLILIAVIHDGTTGQQIASAFQAALTTVISVAGTIVGSVFTGKIVHNAVLSQTAQNDQQAGSTKP